MAIAYKSAGAGFATETKNAILNLPCPTTVDANDILIAHVVVWGTTYSPTTPSGWTLLFGPYGLGTGTPTARAWTYGKLAAGTEDGANVNFGAIAATTGRMGRIYSFSGYVSGDITDVVPSASYAGNSSETDPVIQSVTTTVKGAKAIALVSQDDNNSHSSLGAVTGGTWAEAVADYVSTTVGPAGGCLQLQVGTPTSDPGTIAGGTVAGNNDEANTICFEIRPNLPNTPPTVALDSPEDEATTYDTTPDLEFTGTDPEDDDVEYEVQVATDDQFSVSEVVTCASNGSGSTAYSCYSGQIEAFGQSFEGDGNRLYSATFNLAKTGSPTGNAYVKIYAHTGTFGTDGKPTGSALAVSDAFDVSTLSGSQKNVEIFFSGDNRIVLDNGTYYCVVFEWFNSGDSSNKITFYYSTSSVCDGNFIEWIDALGWTYLGGDCRFVVKTKSPESLLIDALSTEETGFRAGASHPTASGEEQSYTIQDTLEQATYYWRVRALDPSGTNTWGDWSDIQSFAILSGTPADDSRDAKVAGKAITTNSRSAYVRGKLTSNSSRGAKVVGGIRTDSSRNAKLQGIADITNDRNAKVTGKDTANDNRSAKVIGNATANDNRSATILGKDSANSTRNAKLTGSSSANDSRSAKLTGIITDRYWIGGTGNWSDTAHWSYESGGSGGATVPTSTNDVFIDANSGFGSGGKITLGADRFCKDLICSSGHTFTISGSNRTLTISGSITLESGLTYDVTETAFDSTGSETIDCGGTNTDSDVTLQGTGGSWVLLSDFSSNTLNLYEGTFDADTFNVTVSNGIRTDEGGTKILNMGSGNWACPFYISDTENLTINAETSTIICNTSETEYDFGGMTYNNIWIQDVSYIYDSGTFNDFKIDAGITTYFYYNTTTVVSSFTAVGSVGNLITLSDVPSGGGIASMEVGSGGSGYAVGDFGGIVGGFYGLDAFYIVTSVDAGVVTGIEIWGGDAGTAYEVANGVATTPFSGAGQGLTINILTVSEVLRGFTLSKSSGIVECDYLDISNSNATGGATWNAGANSIDSGNNSGWVFQTNNNRSAKITGSLDVNSSRNAKIDGKPEQEEVNDYRSAKLTGYATATNDREAKVTGFDTANDNRSAKVIGKETAFSTRNAKVSGKTTAYNASTAKARIQKLGEKTAQAKSRIKSTGETVSLSAKSRIKTESVEKTTLSKARIGIISEKTISTLARIKKVNIEYSTTSKANIKNTTTKDVSSLARIEKSIEKSISSLADIFKSDNTETLSAKSRIKKLFEKYASAKSRIEKLFEKTVEAKSRVEKLFEKSSDVKARVKSTGETVSLSARADIKKTQEETLTAKSRIETTESKSSDVKARIELLLEKSLQAKARIKKLIEKSLTARADIFRSYDKTLQAKARIKKLFSNDVSAKARILLVNDKTSTAKADIKATLEKTADVKTRIKSTGFITTIQSMADIEVTTDKDIQAKSRIEITTTKDLSARARIEILVEKTISAKARIERTFEKSLSGKSRIELLVSRTISGKASLGSRPKRWKRMRYGTATYGESFDNKGKKTDVVDGETFVNKGKKSDRVNEDW